MKNRAIFNIFLLCCMLGMFFAFGAVANAEESSTPSLNSYPYSLTLKGTYDWGSISVSSTGIHDKPIFIYIAQKKVDNTSYFVCLSDDALTNVSVNAKETKSYTDGSVSTSALSSISMWVDSTGISTNIPVFDLTTNEGKAAAQKYMETGKIPQEFEDFDMDAPKLFLLIKAV